MMKSYYKFDASARRTANSSPSASLPDDLFNKDTPAEAWLKTAEKKEGFAPGELGEQRPIEPDVDLERLIGLPLYMIGNILPFALPALCLGSIFSSLCLAILKFLALYVGVLAGIGRLFLYPRFLKKYNKKKSITGDMKENQYLYTERNNQKYVSLKFVWPESLHRPAMDDTPCIFLAIPHGVAPLGITAYPMWSKLFNDKLCSWVCAPVVLRLPIISKFMKGMGYIPAKSSEISNALTKKDRNVGIILDGVAGMFQSHNEVAYVKKRKGIVKIALRAGAPLVPVYGFGHTKLWTAIVDPFGLLERISLALDVSLVPFVGRWGWPIGPARRVPVCVAIGEPVVCPKIESPTQADIDKYHGLLLDAYKEVFDAHKEAYGWKHKTLQFV